MTGTIEIEIHGVKRALVFNNFARMEIARHMDVDPIKILDSIQELNNRSPLLLIKIIVYAGHCGDCYRRQNVTDLTMDDIGDWVSEADDDTMFAIYKAFMEAEGIGLPEDSIKKKTETSQ